MSKKVLDVYQFTDLEGLREWLNRFETTDLSLVNLETDDAFHISIAWVEETMTDGSTVFNAVFS